MVGKPEISTKPVFDEKRFVAVFSQKCFHCKVVYSIAQCILFIVLAC